MFITAAAAPKSAAAPTAPVFIGIAMPLVLELAPAPDALAPAVPLAVTPAVDDGTGMPLVNGTEDALLAPEKAGAWVLAVGLGVSSGFLGLRTLNSCQCNSRRISLTGR